MATGQEISILWSDPSSEDERRRASEALRHAVERRVAESPDCGWVSGRTVTKRDLRGTAILHVLFQRADGPYRRDLVLSASSTVVVLRSLNMNPDDAALAVDGFFEMMVKPALTDQASAFELRESDGQNWHTDGLHTYKSGVPVAEILDLPATRIEDFTLKDGLGAIRLEGGFESVIYFKGRPQMMTWPDCAGSIGHYFARTGDVNMEEELGAVRSAVSARLPTGQPIATQIAPLLRLFEPGDYKLTNEDRLDFDWVTNGLLKEIGSYYPDNLPVFLKTRPGSLNEATIAEYQDAIARGARPLVITASAPRHFAEFVVDGHHKLRAYIRNQTPPNVLNIRTSGAGITLAEGVRVLDGCERLESTYRKVKAEYGHRWS